MCDHPLHQGAIYSASPPVARALIEFAKGADLREKGDYYTLLTEFAASARKAFADGRAIPCHSGGDQMDGAAIRDAILEAHAQFATDPGDTLPAIRDGAASLLTAFPEASAEAAREVHERYFVEPGPR